MGRVTRGIVAWVAMTWAVQAAALGLGELRLDSALNQNFAAEIPLLNVGDLEASEILPALASAEDFERVGVERFFYLTDLRFRVDLSDPADPVLRITSSRPVTEPFLNFLVEVLWPSGRLLKEYTVLLDPPTYDGDAVDMRPAAAAPGGAAPGPRVSSAPSRPASAGASGTRSGAAPAAPGPRTGRLAGDRYGITDRDDTLWTIALKVRPDDDLSVQQTMLAIVERNPDAFIGGNVNLLKAGYELRLPSAAEIRSLDEDEAVARVAAQNEAWRSGDVRRAPLDARPTAPERRERASDTGELRLVSGPGEAAEDAGDEGAGGSAGTARAPGAGAGGGAADSEALLAARDEIERLVRDRRELADRIESREAEIETLEAKVDVQDETIAELQEQLQALRAEVRRARSEAAPAPEPAPAGGFDWVVPALGGLVAVLIAAVLVLFQRLRRANQEAEEQAYAALSAGADVQVEEEAPTADEETTLPDEEAPVAEAQDFSELDALAEDISRSGLGAPGADGPAHDEGTEVLVEADRYIAYGQFHQAREFLQGALAQDPEQQDVRVKLLEVFAEAHDAPSFDASDFDARSFDAEAARVSASGDGHAIALAAELQRRVPGTQPVSGARAHDDGIAAGFAGAGVGMTGPAAATDDGPLDLDIDLDDGPVYGGEAGRAQPDMTLDDLAQDLDLDLTALERREHDASGADTDLDLGDDRGIDFEPDPARAGVPSGTTGDVSGDAELDLELDEDSDLGRLTQGPADPDAPAPPRPGPSAAQRLDDTAEFNLDDLDFDLGPGGGDAQEARGAVAADPTGQPSLDADVDVDLSQGGPETAVTASAPGGSGASALDDTAEFDLSLEDLSDETRSAAAPASEPARPFGAEAPEAAAPGTAPPQGPAAAEEGALELDDGFDFDLDAGSDEVETKLDLARGFIDMGDRDGARDILAEVVSDGAPEQQDEARRLLAEIE